MSVHTRRRSRGEGGVKKRRRKNAAKAMAAASAIAGGTYAYAEPVRFDNPPHGEPGHFHWPAQANVTANALDVVVAADAQPGDYYAPSAVANYVDFSVSYSRAFSYPYIGLKLQATSQYGGFALGLTAGDAIPAGGSCSDYYGNDFCFSGDAAFIYGGVTYLPEGVPTYLGVAFGDPYCVSSNSCQYGWIGVVRNGPELEAFAWGHETLVATPILAGAGGGGDPTGACCDDATGDCTEPVTQEDCERAGSRFGGDGSDCATIDPACTAPLPGACCDDATGDCTEAVTQEDCETAGSRYGGDGSNCATIDPACTAPLPGACCGPGDCVEVMQTECDAAGRLFRGEGTLCADQANCANIPTVSEWGLFAMSLGMLAAGTWVVRKRQTELDPNQPTAG